MASQNDTEETLQVEGGTPPEPEQEEPETTAPEAAAPEEDDEPDGTAEIEGKGTMVPLAALKSEREKRQQYEKDAKRAKEMETYLQQAKPYIDFLRNNPQLLQPQQPAQPQGPSPQEQQQAQKEFVEYAREFDLYTPDGKPDVERAQRIMQRNQQMAEQAARAAVAPLQQQTLTQRAEANVKAMQQTKDAHGRPVEDQYIAQTVQAITQGVPREKAIEMLADPQVAQLLANQAAVLQFQNKPMTAAPAGDPLFREGQGGGSRYTLSNDEKSLARASGISEKEWARAAKKFEAGKPLSLED